jgi:hypothetical protein
LPEERGSVPDVVEKGIGISYAIGKPIKKKGGRRPKGIDHARIRADNHWSCPLGKERDCC